MKNLLHIKLEFDVGIDVMKKRIEKHHLLLSVSRLIE
jgi:hypothetical protein